MQHNILHNSSFVSDVTATDVELNCDNWGCVALDIVWECICGCGETHEAKTFRFAESQARGSVLCERKPIAFRRVPRGTGRSSLLSKWFEG